MFILYLLHLIATTLCYGNLPTSDNENQQLVKTIAMDGSLVGHASYGLNGNKKQSSKSSEAEEEEEEEEGMGESDFISVPPSESKSVNADVVRRNKSGDKNKNSAIGQLNRQLDGQLNGQSVAGTDEQIVTPPESSSNGKKSVSPSGSSSEDDKWEALRFLLNDHYMCLLFGDFTAWFSMMAVLTISFPFGES